MRHLNLCDRCRALAARGAAAASGDFDDSSRRLYEQLEERLQNEGSAPELQPARLLAVADEVEQGAAELPMPIQADIVARSMILRSHAHRIAGTLDAAGAALQLASLESLRAPTLELTAELLRAEASLDAARRSWTSAIQALDGAAVAYSQIGDGKGQLSCQIKAAVYCGYAQDAERAAALLEDALILAARLDDRRAGLAAAHSLAWFLVELGDVDAAREVAEASECLYEQWPTANSAIKRRWLDGRILYQTGAPLQAAGNLLDVAVELAESGARHDSGLAYLDASAAYAAAGDWHRSYDVAWTALALLSEIVDKSEEQAAALTLLRQALEAGQLQSLCFHRTSLAMAVVL